MKRKKEQTSKGSEHCSPLLQPRCCSQQYPAQHATHLHLYYSFPILLFNPRWSPQQHKRSITLCSSSSAANEQSSTNLMCITSSSLPICSQFPHFPQECATISLSPIHKKLCSSSPISFPPLPSFCFLHYFLLQRSFLCEKRILFFFQAPPFKCFQVSLLLSLSLLPSAQNPKCTTTELSNILLILLNPLFFLPCSYDNPFY